MNKNIKTVSHKKFQISINKSLVKKNIIIATSLSIILSSCKFFANNKSYKLISVFNDKNSSIIDFEYEENAILKREIKKRVEIEIKNEINLKKEISNYIDLINLDKYKNKLINDISFNSEIFVFLEKELINQEIEIKYFDPNINKDNNISVDRLEYLLKENILVKDDLSFVGKIDELELYNQKLMELLKIKMNEIDNNINNLNLLINEIDNKRIESYSYKIEKIIEKQIKEKEYLLDKKEKMNLELNKVLQKELKESEFSEKKEQHKIKNEINSNFEKIKEDKIKEIENDREILKKINQTEEYRKKI